MPNASTPIDQSMQLSLTTDEVAAIHALAAGIAELAEREIEPSAAVVAAVDRGLERLLEDFELSQFHAYESRAGIQGPARQLAAWELLPVSGPAPA